MDIADQYASAGMSPGPELLSLRRLSIERMAAQRQTPEILELTRLFYGLSPRSLDWFVEELRQEDPSFSLITNKREAVLLAAAILLQRIDKGDIRAALAIVVGAAMGVRKPAISDWLLTRATEALARVSVEDRQVSAQLSRITGPAASKISDDIEKLDGDPAVQKAVLIKMRAESAAAVKALSTQVSAVAGDLVRSLTLAREESGMLWWVFAEWSDSLDRPLSGLVPGQACLAIARDLDHLTASRLGPVSIRAMMQRALAATKRDKAAVSLASAVSAVVDYAGFSNQIVDGDEDILPVHGALRRAHLSGGDSWSVGFTAAAKLDPDQSVKPESLALHYYWERRLVALIND